MNIVCTQSTGHINAGTSIAEMESETDLDSDIFRCFNHRRQTRQHSTASKLQIGHGMVCCMMHSIYSARLALFIMSANRTREVWPAILIRESTCSTQLVMYTLDTFIRYSTYNVFTDFQVLERLHGGPELFRNYLIDDITIT